MNNDEYKMVGIFNTIDLTPTTAVYIVFEKDNKYYIGISGEQVCNINYFYTDFLPINEKDIKHIVFFEDCKLTMETENVFCKVGDIVNLAFHISEKEVYVGTLNNFFRFISDFKENIYTYNKEKLSAQFYDSLNEEIEETEELVNKAIADGALESGKKLYLNK